jgi:hypothetical protein
LKYILLDGSIVKLSINPNEYPFRPQELCSKIEWATGQYLKEKFPYDTILCQWVLPSTQLRADFYIPTQRLMVEADGIGHRKFVPFFHGNEQGFDRHKQRDNTKEIFCKLNNIKLIRITQESELTTI